MEFEPLFSPEVIAKRIAELGKQISSDYSGELICVSVLKGSIVFFSDLVRAIERPLQMEFIGVKSYEGTKSTGHVQITADLTADIKGKDVLIVEDIIDTGITMDYLLKTLQVRSPKSMEVCTLLSKPDAHILSHKIKYTGFEISNEFVIGYGLDLNGYYRNLPYIAQVIGQP